MGCTVPESTTGWFHPAEGAEWAKGAEGAEGAEWAEGAEGAEGAEWAEGAEGVRI